MNRTHLRAVGFPLDRDHSRIGCVEVECLAILFDSAHIASPVPSPVHLYNDSVSDADAVARLHLQAFGLGPVQVQIA